MEKETMYLEMMRDTSELLAKEKAIGLGNAAVAFVQSNSLANEVEFWKWMGANYPNHFGNADMIRQTIQSKGDWVRLQLQGKGYEWDFMTQQRFSPTKLFSRFEAGNNPTQAGVDVIEKNIFSGDVVATYQNKAYVGKTNPNYHNTPKDAIVVTNKEKVAHAKNKGYRTKQFQDSDEIVSRRDERYNRAADGKATTSYSLKDVASTSIKAGALAAVIGAGTEAVVSYKKWKDGAITDREYVIEISKAGGDAGITAGVSSAIMIPIQSAIMTAGMSSLITIPIAFVMSSAVNSIVAPCFGRGKYKKYLNEAQYYQNMEDVYDGLIETIEMSQQYYMDYINAMAMQHRQYQQIQMINKEIDRELEELYWSI